MIGLGQRSRLLASPFAINDLRGSDGRRLPDSSTCIFFANRPGPGVYKVLTRRRRTLAFGQEGVSMEKTTMGSVTGPADSYSNASKPRPTPQSCRWGASTLYLAFPEWLSAWDSPWSCRCPEHQGPLETVETCTTCPDWSLRESPGDRQRA